MTNKDLKDRAMKIWTLLLRAESAANAHDYASAWHLAYEAMDIYQPIVDPVMNGEIIPTPKPAKKGADR